MLRQVGVKLYRTGRAKAKDRNFDFGRKLVIDIFGTKTTFIIWISILSQFHCFSEKKMGCLNRKGLCTLSPKFPYAFFCICHIKICHAQKPCTLSPMRIN